SPGDVGGGASRVSPKDQGEALLKIVMLFVPMIFVISYEYYNTGELQRKNAQVSAELAAAKSKIETLKPQVEAVKKFQENKKELESKIGVIRTISKERLKNVKALDALQALMPPKAWLQELSIKENLVVLKGMAVEDIDVSQLMAGLEESVYFAGVNLKSVESKRDKDGVLKTFNIEVFLENM
ncbi:MAG: PilN domain-containing protein, partial [Bdellovibrionia bacterium]